MNKMTALSNKNVMDAKPRDYWLDNIKGILLILVVVGHMTASIRNVYPEIRLLYDFINTFHMCAFLIVTGFLAKRRIEEKDYISVFNKCFIPYLTSQLLLYFTAAIVPDGYKAANVAKIFSATNFTFAIPIYQLWYLAALIMFLLVCIYFQPKKHPVIFFAVAFALSLLVGYVPQTAIFRFTKAVGYFPFFLIGYFIPKKALGAARGKWWLCIPAVAILAGFLYWLTLPGADAISEMYGLATQYSKFSAAYDNFPPVLARFLFLVLVPFISFAFYMICPRRKTIFTKLGQRSMFIFVLHGIPVVLVRSINYETRFLMELGSPIYYWLYVLFCVVVTFFLASDLLYKVFRPILEPNFDITVTVGKLYERYLNRKEKQ